MSQFSMENLEYKPSYGYRRFLVAGLNLALEQTESLLEDAKTRKEFVINSDKKAVMSHLKTGLLMLSDQEFNEILQSVFDDVFKMLSSYNDEISYHEFHHMTQSQFHSMFRKIDICEQYDKIFFNIESIDVATRRVDGFSLSREEKKNKENKRFTFNEKVSLTSYIDMIVYQGMKCHSEFNIIFKKISDQYLISKKEDVL